MAEAPDETAAVAARIARLPPLGQVIREAGLSARKSLGQNFLLDLNLTAKIARAAGDLEGRPVLEVGPGPGGLTRALLSAGARVTAVEKDARAIAALAPLVEAAAGRLSLVEEDAIRFDAAARFPQRGVAVVANLPYNIATRLFTGWVGGEEWPPFWSSLTLMFQREVAARITSRVGEDAYGRLAVLAGWRTFASRAFDVPPTAFIPPPKVWSTVIQVAPRPAPLPCGPRRLERVTAAAFGQRRKMLRQSLKSLGGDPAALLACAGLDPTRRAETVDVPGFVALANCLAGQARGPS